MKTLNGISARYLAFIDDYLTDQKGNPSEAYMAAGLDEGDLKSQSDIIAIEPLSKYLLNVASQVNKSGMCFEIGTYISVTSHGPLGLAMLTSRDLGSVLNLWVSYASIAAPVVQPVVTHHEHEVVVSFQVDQKLAGFHPLIIEILLGVIKSNVKSLTAKTFKLSHVSVSYPAPEYADSYASLLGCPVYFDQPIDQICFDSSLLTRPLTMTNPAGEQLAIHQCEKALLETGGVKPLTNEIKSILALLMNKSPTIEQIARSLNMSERTLRRRLREEGVSFRQLLQEVRFDAAKQLLLNTDQYIEEISFELGYNETSNFRSAFKNWSGLSPKQWRLSNRL